MTATISGAIGTSVVTTDPCLVVIQDVALRYGLDDIACRAELTASQADRGTLTVAVVGQFKAGKSSLLNALMGTPLLPVRALPATSVITVLASGPTTAGVVTFLSGTEQRITPEEVELYVTEQHNPDNRRSVACVRLTTPTLAAFPDLEFVDTPGLGSVFDAASSVSTTWLPNTGAALVAVNATQPLSAADLDLVEQLRSFTPDIVIVLTKADLLTASDLREVRVFVHDQVLARTGMDATVLSFSAVSTDPYLQSDLRAYLRGIQERHLEAVQELTHHRTSQLAAECREYLQLALAATQAGSLAVNRLMTALRAERVQLLQVPADANMLVSPITHDLEAAMTRRLTRAAPTIAARVRKQLTSEIAGWHSSLARETRTFESWIHKTLSVELEPLADEAVEATAPFLQQARESLERLGQAFVQRLTDDVRRALDFDFQPARITTGPPIVGRVDVAISPIVDSRLDLLSWALPMVLIRPAVHRHFANFVGWQVEKNSLRLGYQTAGGAREAIDAMIKECVTAMTERVTSCERMLTQAPDDGQTLRALLERLNGLGT
jgi:GTP-binding protein EngB required for normal cell division